MCGLFIPDMDIALSYLHSCSRSSASSAVSSRLPGAQLRRASVRLATLYSPPMSASAYGWLAITVAVSRLFPACVDDPQVGGSRAGAIGATVGVFASFSSSPIQASFWGRSSAPWRGAQRPRDFPKAILVGFGSFLSFIGIVGTGSRSYAVGMLIHVTTDIPAVRDWFATLF